ncbi:putative D-lactate dehydrogenase (cytochrome) [Helianthus anomalus]
MLSSIQLSRVELLDEVQVKAINLANGKELPEFPTLMFELWVQTNCVEPELELN